MKPGDKCRCIKVGPWEPIYAADGDLSGANGINPDFGQILTVAKVDVMEDGTPIVLFEEIRTLTNGMANWFTRRRFEVVA